MRSPGSILKLWNLMVKKQEDSHKPEELPRKGQEQKHKIKTGLTRLKFQGLDAIHNPNDHTRQTFLGTRDKVAMVMKRHCRYLKTTKDEDKKTLPRYLQAVKRLTVVAENLDPANLDAGESDVGLEVLDQVDVTALEQDLEQPDTGAEVDFDDAAPATTAPTAKVPTAPPQPPETDAARWQHRHKAVELQLLAALKEQRGDASKMRALFTYAQEKAQQKDYAHALQGLDSLEQLLHAAGPAPHAPQDGAAHFVERIKALAPAVQKVEAGGTPAAQQVKALIAEANKHFVAKEYAQANAVLDRVAALVKPRGFSLRRLGKARIEWITTRNQAVEDIQLLRDVLEADFKDEASQRPQLLAALQKLDSMITELNEDLGQQLDDVLNAADDKQRQPLIETAKATMKRFAKFVDEDEIMVELDGNEELPEMQVAAPLRAKLDEIAAALG